MKTVRQYVEDLWEDKVYLSLVLLKFAVAALFVNELVLLEAELNRENCRLAVETARKVIG